MSALLGILQLDRGEPWGYAQIPGLVQAWLQDAGGFAAVGLVVYFIYALSTPTDKSQSEKLRVPVSRWMLLMGALSLITYAIFAATFVLNPEREYGGIRVAPPPLPALQPGQAAPVVPPAVHLEWQPLLLALAGLFAILAVGEPFARDMLRITRRNVSFGTGGARRFTRSLRTYAADLLTPSRVVALVVALGAYALVGAALFLIGVPQLTDIWTGVLLVGVGVFLGALFLLMLFEAEGPVWAIAKLSFKEAVRSQVLWIFLIGVLPFLFPLQWLSSGSTKSSDELRLITSVVTVVLSLLTLIPALLIASFGIPNDIKNLNIYTVVSKPVVRFEIVLGRFVGYVALMTLVMAALTGVSLVLVVNSSLSEKAKAETYTARVPFRGKMELKSIVGAERSDQQEFTGINVGREFDYRRYITGADISPQRIIWNFNDIPAGMQHPAGDRIPVEFTFDIFKLTKGEQNKGVLVKFQLATHNCPLMQPHKGVAEWEWENAAAKREYDKRVAEFEARGLNPTRQDLARPGTPDWEALNQLTEEFGFYEIKGKEVFDYQVMGVEIPAGLIRNAMKGDTKIKDGNPLPRLKVYVKCESAGQYLGAAEPDLYLLQGAMPYSFNFLKSSIGLWCRLCIIIGVAVALSTYLSGILSLLLTSLIFITGFFTEHLNDLANNRNVGGGPFQSLAQVVKAEQPTSQLTDSASTRALLLGDKGVAWVVRRVQNMIPDVDSFSWGNFVAEGFNVNGEYLALNLLVTLGYLLPWAVFAYYLMKSREVAA